MNELTIKQKRFADEYIISGNATEAYKKAGYRASSDRVAGVEGHKLLKNPKIKSYIDERLKQLDSEKIADQQEVLSYLTSVMRGETQEQTLISIGELRWCLQMSQTYQIKQNDIVVDLPKIVGVGYGQFWRSRSLYRVVKGSRGSKKSKTTALNYVIRLLKYPWANLLVIRRYSNTNKQSTYTDFKWAANQLKVAHKFKFNESLPEITVKETGQKILFRGLDDELKITSITVDVGSLCWAWFEEAYQIETEDKFSTVVESIRGSLDVPDFFKQITVTFNPWNEKH